MKIPLVFLGFLLLLTNSMAVAAPAYSLEDLLPRAETVFVGTVTEQKGNTIILSVSRHLRGENPGKFTLELVDQSSRSGLEANSRYFVISQGDDHSGPPTPNITVGQGIVGQAGYRGWIMFPLKTEGKKTYLKQIGSRLMNGRLTLERAQKVVRQTPYGKRHKQAIG